MTPPLPRLLLLTLCLTTIRTAAAEPIPPYDPDPNHLWNRLHRTIFVRTASDGSRLGHDTLDPLLYSETKHLRVGESRRQFLALLEEFLAAPPERHPDDPLRRAVLQRDLWAVFDWAQRGSLREGGKADPGLTAPLAKAIRWLALTPEQIARLPDTYAAAVKSGRFPLRHEPDKPAGPFLPDDLLAADGPWVAISDGDTFAAKTHVTDLRGRAAFDVFVNLPGGRAATLAYLAALRDAKEPLAPIPPTPNDDRRLIGLNPNLPPLPKGTQFALLRRTLLIDRDGAIRSTPLVESLQIRVFRQTPRTIPRTRWASIPDPGEQDRVELVRGRAALFAGEAGGLHALTREELSPPDPLFRSHLHDPIEHHGEDQPPRPPPAVRVLDSCVHCHNGSPTNSFQTLNRFPAYPADAKLPRLTAIGRDVYGTNAAAVIAWKTGQDEWQALVELLRK